MLEKLWFLSGAPENEPEIQDYGQSYRNDYGQRFKQAERSYQCIRKTCIELKAMSDKASKSLEMELYRNDPFKKKSINALSKKILMVLC
jgi:hypothetical protein